MFVSMLLENVDRGCIVCPLQDINEGLNLFIKMRRVEELGSSVIGAIYRMVQLLRDAVDNYNLTISYPKRMRGAHGEMDVPSKFDRDAKMLLVLLFQLSWRRLFTNRNFRSQNP